jgi:hypothetical protein
MMSDEVVPAEDLEATSMEELISKIKKAAKAKHFYAPYLSSSATVHFWATQVVGAMRALGVPCTSSAPQSAAPAPASSAAMAPASAAPAPASSAAMAPASAAPAPASTAASAPVSSAASAPGQSAAKAPGVSAATAKAPFFRPLPLGVTGTTSAYIPAAAVAVAQTALPSKATLLREHFPAFLLKVLYNAQAFAHLHHFVKIFKELAELGCPAPCDLEVFERFAATDPLDLDVDVGSFAPADLTSRMRFFGSPLYRDFLERRCSALLEGAQKSASPPERQKLLEALTVSVQNVDGDKAQVLQKQAVWASTLFCQDFPPAVRVQFVLVDAPDAGVAAERLAFAMSFTRHAEDALDWALVRFVSEPQETPADLTWPT